MDLELDNDAEEEDEEDAATEDDLGESAPANVPT